jgi:hypothetical protein
MSAEVVTLKKLKAELQLDMQRLDELPKSFRIRLIRHHGTGSLLNECSSPFPEFDRHCGTERWHANDLDPRRVAAGQDSEGGENPTKNLLG